MAANGRRTLTLGAKVSYLPYLADALGYFDAEDLAVSLLDKASIKQEQARGERLHAQVNWFHHTVFSASGDLPLVAVMVLNDAPGVSIMVPNRLKNEITSATDFAGRNVAEGASHSAKGVITNYLAVRAGLPKGSYTPVMAELDGRREAVLRGLEEGTVDVLTFMEPMTSVLQQTGMVTTLYDLTTRDSTCSVFGAPWPAECVLVSRDLIENDPDAVQSLVNSFVRTMAYVNSSTPESILESLPSAYVEKFGRESVKSAISNRWPTLARRNYAISPRSAELQVEAARCAPYDDTLSGSLRAKAASSISDPATTFTNRFVEAALSTQV